eukprot:scaffold8745_cov142-Amphora_coffeaeformis.AAC.3
MEGVFWNGGLSLCCVRTDSLRINKFFARIWYIQCFCHCFRIRPLTMTSVAQNEQLPLVTTSSSLGYTSPSVDIFGRLLDTRTSLDPTRRPHIDPMEILRIANSFSSSIVIFVSSSLR